MDIHINEILLLFKRMFCDELKIMIADQDLMIDLNKGDQYNFIVMYNRMQKSMVCIAELLVDCDNQIMYLGLKPVIPSTLEDLILPGKQCPDELDTLYDELSHLLAHPEMSQNYDLTFSELEQLYKLFILNNRKR